MGIYDEIEVTMIATIKRRPWRLKRQFTNYREHDRKYQMRQLLPKINGTKTTILLRKKRRFVINMR